MSTRLAGWLFAGPALLVIALFFGVPVLAALALSLTDFDIYALADIDNLRFVGLGNYLRAFEDDRFWRSTGNTLLYIVVTVPGSLVVGLGLALLANQAFRVKWPVRLGLLLPWALPLAWRLSAPGKVAVDGGKTMLSQWL